MNLDGTPRIIWSTLWGFAEATVFFIVPDVILTHVALRFGLRAGLWAALAASVGALMGGAVMVVWSAIDGEAARFAVAAVPNVSDDMMLVAHQGLNETGPFAMLAGAFGGVPYKVFAVEALSAEVHPGLFLLATVPVRLARFSLCVLVAACLGLGLQRAGVSRQIQTGLFALGWTLFYLWFFAVTPG